MTPQEIREVLADETLPNEPAAIPGTTLTGSHPYVDPVQARERRKFMSAAIMRGASRDAINELFAQKFHMSEHAVMSLMLEVRDLWAQEDADALKTSRGAARRRLLSHINEASKAGKWTAVGNLEKVLSDIEGTMAPEPAQNDSSTTLADAVMSMINATDPAQIRILIERERVLIEAGPAHDPRAMDPKAITTRGDSAIVTRGE